MTAQRLAIALVILAALAAASFFVLPLGQWPTGGEDGEMTEETAAFELGPEDCFPEERYDPVEKACYLQCETEEECAALEAKIAAEAEEVGDEYYEGEKEFADLGEEGTTIASYEVEGDGIKNPSFGTVPDELKRWQEDTAKHHELWGRFSRLVPGPQRTMVSKFEIFTDGKEGTLAAVAQDERDPERWVLSVDIVDAYREGLLDGDDLTYSLIHEYGHLLTLNASQVPPDRALFAAQADEAEFKRLARETEARCLPNFFVDEGCSRPNSYINTFFQKFWRDIAEEHRTIVESKDEAALEAFYEKYRNRFITEYAATNVGEDIAESWTAFVLKLSPAGTTVAEEKTRFFSGYPELVKLRRIIRQRL